MSHKRRSTLEKKTQCDVELEIGSEDDLLIMKNSNGKARYVGHDGREYHVPYGCGPGSPDLIGILRREIHGVTTGTWFCLEIKAEEGSLDPEQIRCHKVWRSFGAFIETVRSAAEARSALERARRGE